VKHYSFVLIDPRGSESDLRTGEFRSFGQVLQLAEVVALDLSIDPERQWAGWTLEVRDVHGQLVSARTVPVVASVVTPSSTREQMLTG